MDVWERISTDPNVCHGKPCVRGTRVMVSVILGALAAGASVEEIVEEFPPLIEADVRAAMSLAALLADEQYVPLEMAA